MNMSSICREIKKDAEITFLKTCSIKLREGI
jgi:hypothetical protein